MGIELSGHIEGGSVVAAGGHVSVLVTVAYKCSKDHTKENYKSEPPPELISLCSAQIHCICSTNDAFVIPQEAKDQSSNSSSDETITSGTSFAPWRGEDGTLVVTTKPTILFCELKLLPGHHRTFRYRETVPLSSPPSYRGHHIKYSWKVTVGAQRLGHKVALLRMPLRVLLLPSPPAGVSESTCTESEEELTPTNPFLHPSPPQPHNLQAIAYLQSFNTRCVRAYNIVHSSGPVLKFTIFKSIYKLGDDILATLDFSEGKIPCVQYAVCLQSQEEIKPEHRRRNRNAASTVSYSKLHELCLALSHSHILLPVPLHITPAFQTDLVSLEYRLHFEFVLSVDDSNKRAWRARNKKGTRGSREATDSDPDGTYSESCAEDGDDVGVDLCAPNSGGWTTLEDGSEVWSAPNELNIETLVWDLPVMICPSPPSQLAAAMFTSDSTASVVI